MKRLFTSAIYLLWSLLTFAQFSAYITDSQGVTYEANDDESTCCVHGLEDNYCATIVIPEVYEGRRVTSIEWHAFDGCSDLTSVTIPNSVTSIGWYAFRGCSGLTSITIPNSVTNIEGFAFQDCSGLTSITIPSSVTSIGDWAFYGCSGLTSITIPSSVTSIGGRAFEFCSGLTSITIPEGVTSIGDWAFSGCSGLTSIVVESGNSVYDSRENCNAIIETSENVLIAGCQNTIIPSSVTSIGGRAFQNCSGLTSITIPSSVTSIGDWAFYGCSGLTSITIPSSVTSIGGRAFEFCSGLTSITIPEGVTSIGDYAFSGCSGLASVTIPYGVTSIGSSAFQGCSSLLSIDLPSSISFIGQKAFYGCDNLTKVKVGMITPLAIAENVFTNLNNATLYVPSSCNSIPEGDDMTKYMKNPNFSEGEKGWTGWRTVWQVKWPDKSDPGRQMPKVNEKCAEAFSAPNFDLYQEVEGLPLGIYEVSVQGFFRFGRGNDAWTEWNKQGEERSDYVKGSPVLFYVNEKATPFKNIFEEGVRPGDSPLFDDLETAKEEQTPLKRYSDNDAKVEITTWEDVSEIHAVENCLRVDGNDGYLFFPDGMKSAHNYFNAGDYKQSISCAVTHQGDKLRIGVRGHTDVGVASDNLDSWAIFDNFKLIYKGTFKAAYQAADVWKDFGTILEVDMPQDNVEVTDVSAIDNVIYMEPFEVLRGTEVTVPLKMKNTAGVRGFQFDMYLPLGVTVKKDGNNCFICSLNDDRKPSGSEHTLTVNEQADGAIRFLCGSQYDETFTGTEGDILTVQLCVDEKMLAGLYPIILKNVKLTETNINNFYLTETVQTAMTVVPYIPGDISGDGVIDVRDYIGVANYILGTPQAGITAAAADVNKDNLVDVSDYIGVANLILYNNIYGQTANASRRLQKRVNTDVSALNNVVYITPFETTSNSETQVSVKIKNTVGIRGFQFDLYLPEGITAKKDGNNRIVCSLNNGRKPNGDQHTLTMSEQPDGAIRFLCGSQYDETFTGTDGEIATLTISVAADVEADNYPIYLRNMKLTETDINNYYTTDEIETSVTVTGPADGRVVLDEASTTAPEAANGVDVRVKRTINANEWSTICLPFAMSATQVKAAFGDDVQLADFTSYDTVEDTGENVVGLTVNFNMVTAIEANHPYVIKVSNAISEFTADNVTIDPEEEPCVEYDNGLTGKKRVVWGSFTGTYVADCVIPYEGDDVSLFLSGNKWWYATAQTKHMKGYRAYFWFTDLLPDVSASRIQMAFNDETANVVELKDGRMEELKSYYNLKGQRVEKPLKKGLYIRNGKKVIIK